ncbi:primosomal replication factor Y (primosomal protein N') [Brochothrix thermosphacta]|uniref:primosomal protein N' n=1 Tax=Brochothrix thermosphacta TaxID=2756 RepID=UPI000D7B72B7|nr:primosomal protein N' [Brochothrix thermosphacta]SPP27927.1 primosomal replication factor Y (primosomal protein N') [Brochothrix thermosphacta]
MPIIAKVIVDTPAMSVDRPFDYLIPEQWQDVILPGMRVAVPFGPRQLLGYVVAVADVTALTDTKKLKEIVDIFDVRPVLTPEMLALGEWMAQDSLNFRISIFQTMLPNLMRGSYEKYFVLKNWDNTAAVKLFEGSETLDWKAVKDSEFVTALQRWIQAGDIETVYRVSSKETKKTKRALKNCLTETELIAALESLGNQAKAQQKCLAMLLELEATELWVDEAKARGISDAVLRSVAEKGWVTIFAKEIDRDPYANHHFEKSEPLDLTTDQETVFQRIFEVQREKIAKTFLLHGVTGSGKTEVYLQTIAEALKLGKQAIMLVPEIALTPQMVERFKSRFGKKVAVLHSALSAGERLDEWQKIEREEADIVVGARSAIFAPLTNIGLIIIDEEHEATYKQEDYPRYHAREVALWRAEHHQCPVVLGSATPNVESFARATKGVYELLELPERVNNRPLPTVEIVDLKDELRQGNTSSFSTMLLDKIKDRQQKGEQTVLMLNRRGFASFVMCRDCGFVPECPNCSITLTYHKLRHQLKCHYCGHQAPMPPQCPSCQSEHIRQYGTGTQKIEEELLELLPDIRIIRMDVDTTSRKGAHEKLLTAFGNGEADILLGTQMIAKGLDFPNITLVGVLNADTALNVPDFRASERTFQLLTQVSGRAGRHQLLGEVVIQTFNPDHYSIQLAQYQNYIAFYNQEMGLRKLTGYPPYYLTALIQVTSTDERKGEETIANITGFLKRELNEQTILLGPTPAPIAKIKNRYRYQCLIKYKVEPNLRDVLRRVLETYQKEIRNGLTVSIDFEPYTMM